MELVRAEDRSSNGRAIRWEEANEQVEVLVDYFPPPPRPGTATARELRCAVLTHCHEDHRRGIEAFMLPESERLLYCTALTRVLLLARVPLLSRPDVAARIIQLPTCLGARIDAEDAGDEDEVSVDVQVGRSAGCRARLTAYEAGHCPGSAAIKIEASFGVAFFSGDFRWDDFPLPALPAPPAPWPSATAVVSPAVPALPEALRAVLATTQDPCGCGGCRGHAPYEPLACALVRGLPRPLLNAHSIPEPTAGAAVPMPSSQPEADSQADSIGTQAAPSPLDALILDTTCATSELASLEMPPRSLALASAAQHALRFARTSCAAAKVWVDVSTLGQVRAVAARARARLVQACCSVFARPWGMRLPPPACLPCLRCLPPALPCPPTCPPLSSLPRPSSACAAHRPPHGERARPVPAPLAPPPQEPLLCAIAHTLDPVHALVLIAPRPLDSAAGKGAARLRELWDLFSAESAAAEVGRAQRGAGAPAHAAAGRLGPRHLPVQLLTAQQAHELGVCVRTHAWLRPPRTNLRGEAKLADEFESGRFVDPDTVPDVHAHEPADTPHAALAATFGGAGCGSGAGGQPCRKRAGGRAPYEPPKCDLMLSGTMLWWQLDTQSGVRRELCKAGRCLEDPPPPCGGRAEEGSHVLRVPFAMHAPCAAVRALVRALPAARLEPMVLDDAKTEGGREDARARQSMCVRLGRSLADAQHDASSGRKGPAALHWAHASSARAQPAAAARDGARGTLGQAVRAATTPAVAQQRCAGRPALLPLPQASTPPIPEQPPLPAQPPAQPQPEQQSQEEQARLTLFISPRRQALHALRLRAVGINRRLPSPASASAALACSAPSAPSRSPAKRTYEPDSCAGDASLAGCGNAAEPFHPRIGLCSHARVTARKVEPVPSGQ